MSSKNPPKNKDTPTYNSNNFQDTTNYLSIEYGDNRFFNKETGGNLGSELKLNPNSGFASLNVDNGDLKIDDSTQGLFLINRYRIKDTYLASSSFKLGKDSQFLMEYDKINLLSSGANGILNYGSKHTMDIKNGKMSINSTTISSALYVNGNMSVNGVVNCTSLVCPTFSPFTTGSIALFPSTTIPTGWLLCNGSSYSKTANNNLYKPLFDVIQYTFGGSGNNFNVPNLTDRFPMGATSSLNTKDGNFTATLTMENIPSHSHNYSIYKAEGYFRRGASATVKYYFWGSKLNTYTEYFNQGDVLPASETLQNRPLPTSIHNGRPYAFVQERRLIYNVVTQQHHIVYLYIWLGDVSTTGSTGDSNPFSIQNPYIKYCYIIKT